MKHGGCNKAILALKTVLTYFNNNESPVFIYLLDAYKAFNRINHYNFLTVLINRGVPENIVMLFYKWISKLSFCVFWNNIFPYACNISSCLLQGNILSPKFFNAYMDELLYKFEESGLGCKLYNVYCGILMYADDILLLCSSITKLQLTVDICVSFGIEMGITFSLLNRIVLQYILVKFIFHHQAFSWVVTV